MGLPDQRQTPSNGQPSGFADWIARGRDGMRKGERTRTDLLVAGAGFLGAHPLDTLTVAAICKHAGIAHGTFYLYFSDKSALASAVLSAFVDHLQDRMRAAARQPGDAVRNTTAAYRRLFEENAGLMKCLVVGVDTFPEARAAFQRLNREWVQTVVRSSLRRHAGAARSEEDLTRRAYALGGMVDQYLSALFITGDPWVGALSEDREAVLEMLTDLWKRGMAP
ncbi:TetR/AcrR family transcriptional regulator [Albidovulum sediminicola]|uniref:TetR/AcrR family transcriptional regulator n=1 Tax=Albidovulum sediminicola TaxID=2984331 RepID=A0ABT2YY40_9RHOB|nr:TetR/AcrR family transcriptional regulator [Defluviimonas sp. WL0075]MCV2863766.1 TetR/AcrR family transcriptional regulator [Defluviimonas sp. WL0075]